MIKLFSFVLILVALFGAWDTAMAQDKDFQTAVLQKLNEMDNRFKEIEIRLSEMDKRYEVQFARIDERFNNLDIKIQAVNQRFDDKFNLIVGLLGLIFAFLALPYIPKLLERYKVQAAYKEDIQRLQEQINELKSQRSQHPGPAR